MKRRNRSEQHKAKREQRELQTAIKAVTEFYVEVAETLDLPPRALPEAPPLPPPPQTREEVPRAVQTRTALAAYRQWLLPAIAVLLLAVVGGVYWWPAGSATVPEDFRGTWVTQDASYAGRMIVVSAGTIEIVAGRESATGPLAVTSTTVDSTASGIRLLVVFGTSRDEQTMEMLLRPGRPTTLTLVRPDDVVWQRLEGPPAPPPGS